MKKYFLILITSGMILTACQPASNPAAVDIEAEKAAVNDVIENNMTAMKEQNVEKLVASFTDDMLAIGSDPSEFWNKQQISDMWKQMLSETSPEFETIGERVIKVAPDGNSAFVVDQFYIPQIFKRLPVRSTYYLIKVDNKWMIYVVDTAVIPKNEDLAKLDAAL